MRVLYGLVVFIGTAVALVILMSALGGVGTIELLVATVVAAVITLLWAVRSRRSQSAAG
jgi:hypothetical protein